MRLFELKIAPCATYGIRGIWENLSERNLEDLERVKACYIKRTLGVAKNSKNRLVYLLAEESTMIEKTVRTLGLRHTEAYKEFLVKWEEKLADINVEFLESKAMKENEWKKPLYERRHMVCREAVHGFHHIYCTRLTFHEETENCRCRYCGQHCEQYHARRCTEQVDATTGDITE
jgi:hypothetical protein